MLDVVKSHERESRFKNLSGFVTTYGDECMFQKSINLMEIIGDTIGLDRVRDVGRQIFNNVNVQLRDDLKSQFKGAGLCFSLPHSDKDDVLPNVHYRFDRLLLPFDIDDISINTKFTVNKRFREAEVVKKRRVVATLISTV